MAFAISLQSLIAGRVAGFQTAASRQVTHPSVLRRLLGARHSSTTDISTESADRTTSGEPLKPRVRVLSGVQPTGKLTLGNYLGAIRQWVDLQVSI